MGIKAIRHPVRIGDKSGGVQHTIAVFNMYVHLPHNFKGTHMSRFVEILNSHEREISVESFETILREMVERLEAESGRIEMSFPYFINKAAPVSGVQSLLDYDVTFIGEIERGRLPLYDEGAGTGHQPVPLLQRHLGLRRAQPALARNGDGAHAGFVWIEDMVRICEEQASCELYGLLKRPDEKYVTEKAYDNPKFVEDMVRDIAAVLNLRPAHRGLRGGIRELRIDPQPLGLRADRTRQGRRYSSRPRLSSVRDRRSIALGQGQIGALHGVISTRFRKLIPSSTKGISLSCTRASTLFRVMSPSLTVSSLTR